jgi:hypothetical protein
MKTFIITITLILTLLLTTKRISAQNYNDYRDAGAVMLQVNGNLYSENKLEGAIVALPDNSNQLIVRLHIPNSSINENAADDSLSSLPDYLFSLSIKVDSWKILESLTSDKTFETDGYLTLNNITKLTTVEYTPLPSPYDEDGGFNLNLIVVFSPFDFHLDVRDPDTRVFIKIGNAPVNRL